MQSLELQREEPQDSGAEPRNAGGGASSYWAAALGYWGQDFELLEAELQGAHVEPQDV